METVGSKGQLIKVRVRKRRQEEQSRSYIVKRKNIRITHTRKNEQREAQ